MPAVAAALEATGGAGLVLVLAVDLPLLTSPDLGRLLAALTADAEVEAVAAADHRGRPNPCSPPTGWTPCGTPSPACPDRGGARPAARLLPERVTTLDLGPAATLNVNTPDDLERARSATVADSPGDNHSP